MIAGYEDFEFDLPGALLANLVNILDKMGEVPLTSANAERIPDEQGVYQLLHNNKVVYVGKTDAEAGLKKRLYRHSRKILHRTNLNPSEIYFKSIRIYVFTAMDLESDLIRHYGGVGGNLPWNGSGFGSNDPGRNRDNTINKPENFDYQYRIDIDRPINDVLPAGPVSEALAALRSLVPYTIRGQARSRHDDFISNNVPALKKGFTCREAIRHIISHLPDGWQATKLLGYIIIYKEDRIYPDSEIFRK